MTAKFLKIVENTLKTHDFINKNEVFACKGRKSLTVICAILIHKYQEAIGFILVYFWCWRFSLEWKSQLATTSKYLEINFTKMLSWKVVTILVSKITKISIFLLSCQILYRQRLKLIQIVHNKTTDHVKWVRDDSIADWGSGGGDVAGMWGGGM